MSGDITLDRPMPCNIDAERYTLGSCFVDPKAIFAATEILKQDDFYDQRHRVIFGHMLTLTEEEKPIDLMTLRGELIRNSDEERAGGIGYYSDLSSGIPKAANVKHYAQAVKDKSVLRRLIHLSNATMTRCFSGEELPGSILESAQGELLRLYAEQERRGFRSMADLCNDGYKELEERAKRGTAPGSVPTGFCEIDRLTGGLRPSNLIIVAARPGIGKTSLCLNIAANASLKHGKRVGIVSLEMNQTEIYDRAVSSEGQINLQRLCNGYMNKDDWKLASMATGRLHQAPIWVDDSGHSTILQIRSKCQRLHADKGLDLIILDYLGLISGSKAKYNNRVEEVTEISRGLKLLSKELQIPIIAACQLNRGVEGRGSKEPNLSDLRESGSIEQDADIVLMLWKDSDESTIIDAKLEKHRNGPKGKFKLLFVPSNTKFMDYTQAQMDSES